MARGRARPRREVPPDVERLRSDGEVEEPTGDGASNEVGERGSDVVLESDVLVPDGQAVSGEDELVASGRVVLVAGAVIRGERAAEEVLAAGAGRARSEGVEERLELAGTAACELATKRAVTPPISSRTIRLPCEIARRACASSR